MDIANNIKSKPLKRLILKNDASLLPPKSVQKIIDLISAFRSMATIDEFLSYPKGKPHQLKGDRRNIFAISVTKNWRLTFMYVESDNSIHILDFEDYH